ncbi:hypothetical protein LCGC14_3133210, partial [marine sediment metagenome]
MILLTALILSACASNRAPLPNWAEGRQTWNEVHDGAELSLLCELPWTTANCWQAVADYEDT